MRAVFRTKKSPPQYKHKTFFKMVQNTNSSPVFNQLGVKKNHVFTQYIDYKQYIRTKWLTKNDRLFIEKNIQPLLNNENTSKFHLINGNCFTRTGILPTISKVWLVCV